MHRRIYIEDTCNFFFIFLLLLPPIPWLLSIHMNMHGNADAVRVKRCGERHGLERRQWTLAKITRHCCQFISSCILCMHFWVFSIDQCRHPLSMQNQKRQCWRGLMKTCVRKIQAQKYGRGSGAVFSVVQNLQQKLLALTELDAESDRAVQSTDYREWYRFKTL